jgi:hypothetical protein
VIFRQLMRHDPERSIVNHVTRYSDQKRVELVPLLETIHGRAGPDPRFTFVRQILGYYYYVEVYEFRETPWAEPTACVFEGADLGELRRERERSDVVHELVFHPGGTLNATWQPWDGVLLA